tara:strand:- start:41766 stop:42359 length:594 start_codon:yes stop_codon:yes gene_type:complete
MFKELNILQHFFKEPIRQFNVRELARILKQAPATVSKELKALAKKGILQQEKERRFHLYKANIDSEYYKDLKVYYTIRQIKETGLLEALNKFYWHPDITLFGSAARGMDTETSDIDLLLITDKTEYCHELKQFEKKLHREIQIFPVKHVKSIGNKHLVSNMMDGIPIQGQIEWIWTPASKKVSLKRRLSTKNSSKHL